MLQAQTSVLEIIEACRLELQWRGVQRITPEVLSMEDGSGDEMRICVRWTWSFKDGQVRDMPDMHYKMLLKSDAKLPKVAQIDANSLSPSGIVGAVSLKQG